MLLATKQAMNTPIVDFNFTKYIIPVYVQFIKNLDNVKVGIHA
jgi:hypothetical protein